MFVTYKLCHLLGWFTELGKEGRWDDCSEIIYRSQADEFFFLASLCNVSIEQVET
jgi:hypothetical protein